LAYFFFAGMRLLVFLTGEGGAEVGTKTLDASRVRVNWSGTPSSLLSSCVGSAFLRERVGKLFWNSSVSLRSSPASFAIFMSSARYRVADDLVFLLTKLLKLYCVDCTSIDSSACFVFKRSALIVDSVLRWLGSLVRCYILRAIIV